MTRSKARGHASTSWTPRIRHNTAIRQYFGPVRCCQSHIRRWRPGGAMLRMYASARTHVPAAHSREVRSPTHMLRLTKRRVCDLWHERRWAARGNARGNRRAGKEAGRRVRSVCALVSNTRQQCDTVSGGAERGASQDYMVKDNNFRLVLMNRSPARAGRRRCATGRACRRGLTGPTG